MSNTILRFFVGREDFLFGFVGGFGVEGGGKRGFCGGSGELQRLL